MDDTFLSYIHMKTPNNDCFPPYIRQRPSFDSFDSSTATTISSNKSNSTSSTTTATPPLPTSYTEPNTPLFKGGFFQHEIQIPMSVSMSIPALDEQVRVRRGHRLAHSRGSGHSRNRSEMSMPMGGVQMQHSHHTHPGNHGHVHSASIGTMNMNMNMNGSGNGNGSGEKVAADCPQCGLWTWNVNRHLKYRCKERKAPNAHHIPRTSAPLNISSNNHNNNNSHVVNCMENDLAMYAKQLESKSIIMERMTQSMKQRNEVLENEKAEMSSSIGNLMKQVQWLSRKVNLTLQEVNRLNRFIAEQGGQVQC